MSDQVDHVDEHYVRLQFGLRSSFTRILKVEEEFNQVVSSVTHEVVGDTEAKVDWVLDSATSNGVVLLHLTPEVRRSNENAVVNERGLSNQIVDAVVDGFVALEESAEERPAHFTDPALDAAVELARLSDEVERLGIRNGHRQTPVTARTGVNAKTLLAPLYRDFGTIEGTIEGINVHRNRYFRLYESLTGRGIRCDFGTRIDVSELAPLVERRVAVRGVISYNREGQPSIVRVEAVHPFPPDEELPKFSGLQGMFEE